MLHATVPDASPARVDLLRGAEVSLVLGENGDIERIAVTERPADNLRFTMDLAVNRVGEPGLVTPAQVGERAPQTLSQNALDAAGIEPVELGRVPAGWALTGTQAAPGATSPGPGSARNSGSPTVT